MKKIDKGDFSPLTTDRQAVSLRRLKPPYPLDTKLKELIIEEN
jgi:hypothetical protein